MGNVTLLLETPHLNKLEHTNGLCGVGACWKQSKEPCRHTGKQKWSPEKLELGGRKASKTHTLMTQQKAWQNYRPVLGTVGLKPTWSRKQWGRRAQLTFGSPNDREGVCILPSEFHCSIFSVFTSHQEGEILRGDFSLIRSPLCVSSILIITQAFCPSIFPSIHFLNLLYYSYVTF